MIIKGEYSTNKQVFNQEEDSLKLSNDDCYWFFVNGMIAPESAVLSHVCYLNELFGCNMNHIYNPSNGLFCDLWQIYKTRILNKNDPDISNTVAKLISALMSGKKCIVIAHSQGGLIMSRVMDKLLKDEYAAVLCKNLEVYTFGSAMDHFVKPHTEMISEHFINENDFVARVGVSSYKSKINGSIFTRKNAVGHLLDRNYLGAFSKGLHCNKTSSLYSKLTKI